jgi:hypothetical protein
VKQKRPPNPADEPDEDEDYDDTEFDDVDMLQRYCSRSTL